MRRSTVTDATPLLELRGLNKSFGPVQVLRDVDFSVYAGEVTALVGDNGAGKSTLVKCVGGIYPIDSGEYLLRGQAGHHPRPARRRRARHRDRLPGPRAVRQPRHRPEHVPRPGDSEPGIVLDDADHGADGRARRSPACRCAPSSRSASTCRQPLRRPAPDGRHRQGRAVEQPGRHPRRADRRPRRGADRPGARAGAPAGRQRPRRGADLAQHERRVRGLRPHRRALPRPDGAPRSGPPT